MREKIFDILAPWIPGGDIDKLIDEILELFQDKTKDVQEAIKRMEMSEDIAYAKPPSRWDKIAKEKNIDAIKRIKKKMKKTIIMNDTGDYIIESKSTK